jgi:hypothetical protein
LAGRSSSDIAPKKLIGLTSGIFNFSANLAGIVTPLVIGIAFDMTGSFVGPLVYIGVVALVGAFSYSVILGDIIAWTSPRTDPVSMRDGRVVRSEVRYGAWRCVMSRRSVARDADKPVRQQLERLLASATFKQVDRLKRFLTFIVLESIAGVAPSSRSTSSVVHVFGKEPSFDPRTDPIVRVQARRLRAKLVRYYQEEGASDEVIIDLPEGRLRAGLQAEGNVRGRQAVDCVGAGQPEPPSASCRSGTMAAERSWTASVWVSGRIVHTWPIPEPADSLRSRTLPPEPTPP